MPGVELVRSKIYATVCSLFIVLRRRHWLPARSCVRCIRMLLCCYSIVLNDGGDEGKRCCLVAWNRKKQVIVLVGRSNVSLLFVRSLVFRVISPR